MPNIYDPEFEDGERPKGFRGRRARIGYQLASELIGASLWELPPGEAAYPYHFHYADEELIVVLRGRPTLRTPAGLRELVEGEALRFPVGEQGAHQVVNRSADTVTFLAISTHGMPEVTVYPDEQKLGFGERHPRGGGLRGFYRIADAVDYHEGVVPPERG